MVRHNEDGGDGMYDVEEDYFKISKEKAAAAALDAPNGAFWVAFKESLSKCLSLPNPKLHYDAIFQPAIPETWQEC